MDKFFMHNEHPWNELGGGMRRQVMSWNDDLMAVRMCFEKGSAASPHAHDIHTQISYIIEGSFEVEVNGEKKILTAGDSFMAAPNIAHGVTALENGAIVDVFTPKREDFLK